MFRGKNLSKESVFQHKPHQSLDYMLLLDVTLTVVSTVKVNLKEQIKLNAFAGKKIYPETLRKLVCHLFVRKHSKV